jgi:SAM-dependent methyltransferase
MSTIPEEQRARLELAEAYGKLAASENAGLGCCGPGTSGGEAPSSGSGQEAVPALGPGLGCGDAVSLARLEPGLSVLDLGSGGGLDCFRASEQVGEAGRVIGVDMTPEMISKARSNLATVGADNVEFRLGEIEHLPVADESVDVVMSNCVLNLAPDKDRAFGEALRVLKPGGRLAVCDVLLDQPMPEALLKALPDGGACLGGTAHEAEYVAAMERAGFTDVHVQREFVEPVNQAGAAGESGARMMVQIGETGSTVASVELAADIDLASLPRSFNGSITAKKPKTPVEGPDLSAE